MAYAKQSGELMGTDPWFAAEKAERIEAHRSGVLWGDGHPSPTSDRAV